MSTACCRVHGAAACRVGGTLLFCNLPEYQEETAERELDLMKHLMTGGSSGTLRDPVSSTSAGNRRVGVEIRWQAAAVEDEPLGGGRASFPQLITQRSCPGLRVSTDLTPIQFDPRPERGGLRCRCQSRLITTTQVLEVKHRQRIELPSSCVVALEHKPHGVSPGSRVPSEGSTLTTRRSLKQPEHCSSTDRSREPRLQLPR
ncbi:unnamed protein product [Pleuronectes platessa]|uniref:Uncharacterized protein n=1 Tax=Pleuronectes platessa TaxID=8262 RepID=A0A9N7VGC1_PLEPL|nr:unnamed protein product [Pleuronectes platessa]